MSHTDGDRRNGYMKNYYRRKKLLHYLINLVEQLENVCIGKSIFKFRKCKFVILNIYKSFLIMKVCKMWEGCILKFQIQRILGL